MVGGGKGKQVEILRGRATVAGEPAPSRRHRLAVEGGAATRSDDGSGKASGASEDPEARKPALRGEDCLSSEASRVKELVVVGPAP